MKRFAEILISDFRFNKWKPAGEIQDWIHKKAASVTEKNTEEIYKLANKLYDEELERAKHLDDKGLSHLKISGATLALLLTSTKLVTGRWVGIFLLAAALLILSSAVIAYSAVRAKIAYKTLGKDDILNEEMLKDEKWKYLKYILIHILFVWVENERTNEIKGRLVAIANRLFILSLVSLMPVIIMIIIKEII